MKGPDIRELARSLGCATQAELCELAGITLGTEEAWRKRGTGPGHTRIGNTVLYPLDTLAEFLHKRARRPHGRITVKDVL